MLRNLLRMLVWHTVVHTTVMGGIMKRTTITLVALLAGLGMANAETVAPADVTF